MALQFHLYAEYSAMPLILLDLWYGLADTDS